jgi:hypothetical protein
MRKLIVIAACAMFALLVGMLREIRAQVDVVPPQSSATSMATPIGAKPPAPVTQAPSQPDTTAVVTTADAKVNLNSDEFFDRFVERQPKAASRAAMSCYHRGLHRRTMDQWIRFSFVGHIKNGEVTFSDVKAKESRLDDKELEDCMLAAVANARWHDDSLPDVDRYEDETTLNPERGGKKYMHDADE